MIKELLGDPHVVVALNSSGSRKLHLWRASAAEEIEADEAFEQRAAAAAKRSATGRKAAETRAEEVHEAAREIAETLEVRQPASWDALRRLAGAASELDDEACIVRRCGNYLRHECSDYDVMLKVLTRKFRGRPGVREIYAEVVRPEIDLKVSLTMDRLREAAEPNEVDE